VLDRGPARVAAGLTVGLGTKIATPMERRQPSRRSACCHRHNLWGNVIALRDAKPEHIASVILHIGSGLRHAWIGSQLVQSDNDGASLTVSEIGLAASFNAQITHLVIGVDPSAVECLQSSPDPLASLIAATP
jgi:hypothetical protein